VENVTADGGRGHDDIDLMLTPASRGMSVDGGSSRDLVTFDARKVGFGKSATITVDLARGVLLTRTRVGRVRSLEVLWIKGADAPWLIRGSHRNEDVIMQGGRSLEARMRGGRDSVVATRGPDVLDLGQGRGDFANGRRGKDTCLGAERVVNCESLSSHRSGRAAYRALARAGAVAERVESRTQVVPRLPLDTVEQQR
jgi:hypothetical protein